MEAEHGAVRKKAARSWPEQSFGPGSAYPACTRTRPAKTRVTIIVIVMLEALTDDDSTGDIA